MFSILYMITVLIQLLFLVYTVYKLLISKTVILFYFGAKRLFLHPLHNFQYIARHRIKNTKGYSIVLCLSSYTTNFYRTATVFPNLTISSHLCFISKYPCAFHKATLKYENRQRCTCHVFSCDLTLCFYFKNIPDIPYKPGMPEGLAK